MENNRTMTTLAGLKGRVYVYLSDPETGNKFMQQAETEGFTFSDGVKPTDPERGYERIMAVNHNLTLNYVGTNGRIAFGGGFKKVNGEKLIRVDYKKYISGERNYKYSESD